MDLSSLAIPLPRFGVIEAVLYLVLLVPTTYTMIKGAPFVPTQMKQVDRMLKAVPIKPGMKVYDLGSGDGRLVHKAAKKYKAKATGFEYSPLVWLWAKFLSLFWRSEAKLKFGNLFKQDLSDADVIVCYLLPGPMKKMREEIYPKLKKGAFIVSHAFHLPDAKVWKKLPKDPNQKLAAVWIYKKD